MNTKKVLFKSASATLAVAGGQIAIYLTILTLLANSEYAFEQFALYKFYIISLALGFGAQIGLFIYLRNSIKGKSSSGKIILVSGTTSTTSMVSCCVHHLASILPVIGASGIISTIGQYQTSLYWVGLSFNAIGIIFIASRIFKLRSTARHSTVALSVVAIAVFSLLSISCSGSDQSAVTDSGASELQSQTNQDGPVSITVTPQDISDSATTWDFQIALNTHMGDLGEDLTQVIVLVADGKEYKPVVWDGDPPGGHHRRGVLKFDPVSPKPGTITLKIHQVGGIDEISFTWNI